MRGQGTDALVQGLLRPPLPFRGQREQRELQRADSEIREEGSGHRREETERINRKINAKPRGILGCLSASSSFESMLSKERDTPGGHVPP